MRTSIVIDDELMAAALRATGSNSKQDVVDQALRLLLRIKRQEEVRAWRGRLRWDGDLERSRRDGE